MGLKTPSRTLEVSSSNVHVGWSAGKPAYAVFSLSMARILFEEFQSPVAICVAPPVSAFADTYEQAIAFFSDDKVTTDVVLDVCMG
jgi:hypothetical protein